MILHIYHCNRVIIKDYKESPGQNRPRGVGRSPSKPGRANVNFLPPTTGFGSAKLNRLLTAFQSIDLSGPEGPIRINYQYLQKELEIDRSELRKLMAMADSMGLLQRLTIFYDHEKWMKSSKEKGCLVVMTGVEDDDLRRNRNHLVRDYCDVIDEIRTSVTNGTQRLRHVFVVPNGHLAPRAQANIRWEESVQVIDDLVAALKERGYKAARNSYGYTKIIELAINAHKLGYLLRVI